MAQQYDPGASATEIKLGQTMPFSGPVSVAGVVGHASLAYFDAVNKAGGINGRQIKLMCSTMATARRKPSRRHGGWSRTRTS